VPISRIQGWSKAIQVDEPADMGRRSCPAKCCQSDNAVEVSGRYSNPRPQSVDLGERLLAYPKIRGTRAEIRPSKQHQRRLRPEEVERLSVDYLAGAKVTDLAQRFGITRQTVLEHVRRLGLPRRHPKLGAKQAALAAHLYEAGNSLAVVGIALEVDPGTIRRALAGAGVSIRDPHGRYR